MTDKVQLIKQEIERLYAEVSQKPYNGEVEGELCAYDKLISFIDSLPDEPGCEDDLIAKSENKNFEEIDRYCTLCMDINCFGCQYHDIHFRDVKW